MIAANELHNFSALIPMLYSPKSIADFPSHVLSCLTKFIDLDEPSPPASYFPQQLIQIPIPLHSERQLANRDQWADRLFGQSIDEYLTILPEECQIDRGSITKVSNVVSRSNSHHLESVYWRFLHPVGLENPIGKVFTDLVDRATTHAIYLLAGDMISLSISRERQTASDRDRYLLDLIQPHLVQAHQNAVSFTDLQAQLDRQDRVLEESGTVLLSPDGKVQLMTKRAWKLLNQYFAKCSAQQLPQDLQQWLYEQISLLVNNSVPSLPCVPLHVGKSIQRLTINLKLAPDGEQYLLRLKEHQAGSFSIESLQLLGLTKREAEVLWLIAKDLNNPDIAQSLDCSLSTVKKHLEHIYEKLKVQSRTAAVMQALVQLGLISE